jgi:hypothetical protein
MSMSVTRSGNLPPNAYKFVWMAASAKWADTVGPVVLDAMKKAAPLGKDQQTSDGQSLATRHRPGTLRSSIRFAREASATNTTATWTAYTPYAGFVINGTSPHEIWPVAAKYLHFVQQGVERFVGPKGSQAHVNHPGTKPNPFNRRVMEEMMEYIQRTYREIMQEALGA